ncbi:MAG: phytanoyl-CoA dioxygenase family protein [bacterium]|nr:phytanoyl-CoA dioxygenase family protein [bacterium]
MSGSSISESYRREGYYFPIPVLSGDEALECRRRLEAFEAEHQGLPEKYRFKTYLVWTWLDRLIRHPRILDAVEAVIGPDILCWSTDFFIKEARDPGFVSWHQDSTYWGLEPPDVITAWLGLTDSTEENGCVRVVAGSHLWGQVTHHDTFGEDNLLSRGQEVMVEVDESEGVDLRLSAGEISLHHVLAVHGSRPNASSDRRIGIAFRYLPTHVRQTAGVRESAMLVRGVDEYGHFDLEPRPRADFDEAALAAHADATERFERFGETAP